MAVLHRQRLQQQFLFVTFIFSTSSIFLHRSTNNNIISKKQQQTKIRLADEAIFQDGEASLTAAIQTFTFYLQKAKQVKKLGFLPTETSDVFYPKGYVPTSWADYRTGSR